MEFLIIRDEETIGGLKINMNGHSLIDFNQDLDMFLETRFEEFFENICKDFLNNFDDFEFLGLKDKLVSMDLWNKCDVSCNVLQDCFEVLIFGDDGLLEFEIKPLNDIKFFEV